MTWKVWLKWCRSQLCKVMLSRVPMQLTNSVLVSMNASRSSSKSSWLKIRSPSKPLRTTQLKWPTENLKLSTCLCREILSVINCKLQLKNHTFPMDKWNKLNWPNLRGPNSQLAKVLAKTYLAKLQLARRRRRWHQAALQLRSALSKRYRSVRPPRQKNNRSQLRRRRFQNFSKFDWHIQ